jgi:hypothetical protein
MCPFRLQVSPPTSVRVLRAGWPYRAIREGGDPPWAGVCHRLAPMHQPRGFPRSVTHPGERGRAQYPVRTPTLLIRLCGHSISSCISACRRGYRRQAMAVHGRSTRIVSPTSLGGGAGQDKGQFGMVEPHIFAPQERSLRKPVKPASTAASSAGNRHPRPGHIGPNYRQCACPASFHVPITCKAACVSTRRINRV